MSYNDGAAFRRALEDRLLAQRRQSSVALVRLRKLVAFDRLLARLAAEPPGQWQLKAGGEHDSRAPAALPLELFIGPPVQAQR